MEIGLVTNGTLIDRLQKNSPLTWCRISSSDELPVELRAINRYVDSWFKKIHEACEKNPQIDWAFSHVRTRVGGDLKYLTRLIKFANEHSFTHIRIVSDIYETHNLSMLRSYLQGRVDLSKVIFQPRSKYTPGSNPCFISLLKPVIGADGFVYPCCGTQYALANPGRDYEKTMRMGLAKDLEEIIGNQKFFDGRSCVKCYYNDYNWALGVLLSDLKHEKFV